MLERVLFRPSLASLVEALADAHRDLGLPIDEAGWAARIGGLRSQPEGSLLWTPIPRGHDLTLTWWTDAENQRWFLIERDADDDDRPPPVRLYPQGAFLCGEADRPAWVLLCRCGATVPVTAGMPWMGLRCPECHHKRQRRESTPRAISFPTWCPAECSLVWPDGSRLVVVADGSNAYRALLRDARDRTLRAVDWITRPWKKAQVSDDGTCLMILTHDGRLIESPGLDGERRLVVDRAIEHFWLDPRGDAVAVKIANKGTEVYLRRQGGWVFHHLSPQLTVYLVSWRTDGAAYLRHWTRGVHYHRLDSAETERERLGKPLDGAENLQLRFTEGDLLLASDGNRLRLFRRSGRGPYQPYRVWGTPAGVSGPFEQLVLSPDRRFLATFTEDAHSPLWVIDLRAMETVLELHDWPQAERAGRDHLAFTHDGHSLIVDHHQVIPWRALARVVEPPADFTIHEPAPVVPAVPTGADNAPPFRTFAPTVERFLRNPTRDEITQTLAEMGHITGQAAPASLGAEHSWARMQRASEGGLVEQSWSVRWITPHPGEHWVCLRFDPAHPPGTPLPPIAVDFYRQGSFHVGRTPETMQQVLVCRCGAMLRAGEGGWQHRRCAVCDIKREYGQRTPREVSFPTWCPPIRPGGSAFLPKGERVVAFPHGSDEIVLERRDARDRRVADLGTFPAGGRLSASPDGFWVAYHRRGEMPHLYSSMDRRWIPCEVHASSLVFAPTGDRLAVRLQHDRWRFLRYAAGRWWGVGDGGNLPQLGWSAEGNEAITTDGRRFAHWRWSRLNVTEGGHYVPQGASPLFQTPQGPRRRYLGLFGGPHPGCWHLLTRRGIRRVSLVGNEPQRRAFRPIDLEGLSRQSFTLSSNQRWLAYKQNRCILLEDLYTLHRVGVLEPRLAHDIHVLSFADGDRLLVVNGHEVLPWYRLLWMTSDK